jgi:HSP20 family protein
VEHGAARFNRIGRGLLRSDRFNPAVGRALATSPLRFDQNTPRRKMIMNTLTRWDPFKEMEEAQNRLARIFGLTPARTGNGGQENMTITQWAPSVDIIEDDKEWLVKADLPEVKKEDVKVTVENGVLTITGERKFEKEEKDKKYHRIERAYGNFLRSFTLPDAADGAKVNAEFKDGVLKVHLPKSEQAKPKAFDVKVS